MAKPNALVKISGDGKESTAVFEYLDQLSQEYHVVVLIGGGSDISKAFDQAGHKTTFCPLGRVTETLDERQLARNTLEKNQAHYQDTLDTKGITARAIIPYQDIGDVACPVNGDIMILTAYIGYDKFTIFTREDNVEPKKIWLKELAQCFRHISNGDLDKIEVRSF